MERNTTAIQEDASSVRSSDGNRIDSLEGPENNVIQLHTASTPKSVLDVYLLYSANTEPPAIFHRWSCITSISALLGRSIFLRHGHFRIFPNLYTMFLGNAGSRKSTAIKMCRNIISEAGYETFAAEKTSKEKFLLDLEGLEVEGEDGLGSRRGKSKTYDALTETNLWGDLNYEFAAPREVFICADEFNEFAGSGNMEFYTTLGNLWDWDKHKIPYQQRVKNSRSVSIYQPTVTLLAGNTPESFSRAFPPEVIGHGFLSRLLLIHGKKREVKIAFPESPPQEETDKITVQFKRIISRNKEGEIQITGEARELLTVIYERWPELPDVRFAHYSQRRFTQLLKLCITVAISMWRDEIDLEVVLYANTILSAAEATMPKALGEFGKARNSDVTHKIMMRLADARKPVGFKDLWTIVSNDLDKPLALQDLMHGLAQAEKIQYIQGQGYLPKIVVGDNPDFIDWNLLTTEEREGVEVV